MNTIASRKTSRFPEYLASKRIKSSDSVATGTQAGKLAYIAAFNNCIVKGSEGDWALIHATPFVCEGIARILSLDVYTTHTPDHYVVSLKRASGTAVVLDEPKPAPAPRTVTSCPKGPAVDLVALLAEIQAEARS